MSQFKRLVVEILDRAALGQNEAAIARELQCGRSVVDYVLTMYGEGVTAV